MSLAERVKKRLASPGRADRQSDQNENQFGYRGDFAYQKWPPPKRGLVFLLGTLSLGLSFRRTQSFRRALSLFGIASMIRSVANQNVTSIVGWLANPTVRLKRVLQIHAPVEEVYDFLKDFANYSRFMSYVERIDLNSQGGLRWTLRGPAHLLFQWDTSLGKMVQNQAISWKSSGHSWIHHSGDIQLRESPNETTQVSVELIYSTPVGVFGYAAVHALGYDPKEKIDEDLQVLKALIESRASNSTIKAKPTVKAKLRLVLNP